MPIWQRRKNIMLAYPFEESRLKKWEPPYIIQPKLDGDRCRAIFSNSGEVTLLSSEENPIESVPHINRELESLDLHDIELDGELYLHNTPHQQIHSIVSRTREMHPDFESIEYHVFDICLEQENQATRSMLLVKNLSDMKSIKRVPSKIAQNLTEIIHNLDAYIEEGYEGIIIRNLNYPYLRKRSTGMMKFKPRKLDTYRIIGYEEEIDQYGTPKGALGALILQSDIGQVFKVGSGSFLTRDNRYALWQIREDIIGKEAEVAYQHLTDRQVPRFPVLLSITEIKDMYV